MHNMGKTIGELHALLIEYEKGLPKKATTPQVIAIQDGRIHKANKKSLNAKGKGKGKGKRKDKPVYILKPKNPKPSAKERPTKDDVCHHYKEVGHWKRNCPAYLAELIKKKKQVGTASSSSARRILNMVPTKKVDKTLYELRYGKVPNLSYLKVWGCEALVKRDTPYKLQQRSVKCIFIGYPKETMGYYFYFPPKKIVVARYAEFLEKNLISQEVIGRAVELEEIQDEDTSPFENTSEIPMKVKGFKPPQEEVVPVRRSARTHRPPNCLCLNCLDAMNAEMQSIKDNQVWRLVDLPPNSKTIGSKWIFKKKTDMYGIVHTYKSHLVAKRFTQTYGVNYEKMLFADIRAIRILIAIATFYDYEIWQIDVKTAFLNGYFDEDIYMVQPEGFVDPKHLRKVWKLQRSIHGLKQASRNWNKRFDEEIKRMDNSKHANIPVQDSFDLNKIQGASTLGEVKCMKNVPYASVVESIMYAVRCTRPDVAFANTKDMFLVYGGNPKAKLRVDCYCNAGFETDRDDIKSQTRYIFVLNGGAVDWKSSKQSTIAMFATKAEYIAASEAAIETVWIRKFVLGLDFFKDFKNEFPAIVYNDALTSKSDFLTEPTISIQHIDEFNMKDETSLSECDEKEQNVLNFNDLFPFNVIYPNDLKSDMDNDDDKVDINTLRGIYLSNRYLM
ncbi:retrotransposon protein, putative, ty1-copia subclass [Tanacetum coccineum]|uniref:Retrotransposon protein, putative, ty1-copia subclass n=1 Tax=Tanacetum coccineum TaxID=301880 RepID=A0ABQ5C1X9_9ASTR